MHKLAFKINQIIGDFVLIAFFFGNDFLPRQFCFDIESHSLLEEIIVTYKSYLEHADSYLQDNGTINWISFKNFLNQLSKLEDRVIRNKKKLAIQLNEFKTGDMKGDQLYSQMLTKDSPTETQIKQDVESSQKKNEEEKKQM